MGDVSFESSLDVGDNLYVRQESYLYGDVSMGSGLVVLGDVSFDSSLDISDNLYVHQESYLYGDVSMGAGLVVLGDVSFESSLDVSHNLYVRQETYLYGDVSMGAGLIVMGDVSFESSLDVSDNLYVHAKSYLDGDVSMENNLYVKGNTTIESSLDVSSLDVSGQTNLSDVSILNGTCNIGDTSQLSYFTTEIAFDGTSNIDNTLGNTIFKLWASSDTLDTSGAPITNNAGIVYNGDVIIGNPTWDHDAVADYGANVEIYGNLRIKDGGGITIEDNSSNTVTYLNTETTVTDAFIISNDGTKTSLTVNQVITEDELIVEFMDNSFAVVTIGGGGYTYIAGDVSMQSSASIANELSVGSIDVTSNVKIGTSLEVDTTSHLKGLVTMDSGLNVDNDVSLNSSNLYVNGNSRLTGTVYIGNDVSMNQSLDIVDNLYVHKKSYFDEEVSMGNTLTVIDNVYNKKDVDISDNLYVHAKSYLDGDVSMGAGLVVMSDVSFESSLDVSDNLYVRQETYLDGDVSMGAGLTVLGDVSLESSLEFIL